jgi:hypothetical protein
MPALWSREPTLILAAVNALLALGIGFGAPVTTLQLGLILAATSALLGLVTRSQVTPAQAVVAQVDSDGAIIAGPAHPLADGTRIRPDADQAE